ncbi:TetR family transcriptional regulator [Streptomyces sp. NPDC050704]|uniref:TetR/AcrR family transcriptional regulator n=1 Tax=Streptomyces sp. NPDC050704 TaxID=3157219 RepID=UPI0034218915
MRPSSRTKILDAAIRVTEREGITSLTLDAAAEEAGVTKGGLLYHFRTRDELLVAIQRHLTEAWEERLLAELGRPHEEATARERVAAYARLAMRGGTSKADLAFMLESAHQPELAQVWYQLMERWLPELAEPRPDQADLLLAWLAADGLWMFEATTRVKLAPAVKEALHQRITALAESSSDTSPRGKA